MAPDWTPLPDLPPERDPHDAWASAFLVLLAVLTLGCVLAAIQSTT